MPDTNDVKARSCGLTARRSSRHHPIHSPPVAGFHELKDVKQLYPHGYHGVGRDGHACYYELSGIVQVDPLLAAVSMDRLIRYATETSTL